MTHELQKLVVAPLLLLIQVERVRPIHLEQKERKKIKKATRAILGLASPLQKRTGFFRERCQAEGGSGSRGVVLQAGRSETASTAFQSRNRRLTPHCSRVVVVTK